jgi:hypothetical protein
MISADYAATKDYRDGLERTLELARLRMSAGDFEGLAVGIRQEITRLNLELAKYYEVDLPRTPFTWASLLVHGIEIVRKSPSIRFNSPRDSVWTARAQQPESSVNATYAACGV